MKKPMLLFSLKCFAIIYLIAFADVERFTTVPTSSTQVEPGQPNSVKQVMINTKNTDPNNDNLYFTHL